MNNEMRSESSGENLASIPDMLIIQEAARRLQKEYRREFGTEMRFGSFRFIYHDGQLRQIEEHPRNRRYLMLSKRLLATGS